jgi:high affinity Mn2+ porin
LHAYCRCLRYCPPVRDIEPSKTQGSETGTSKNGDGDKDEDKAYGEDNSSGPEENSANKDKEKYKEGWCSAHAQGTVITQKHSRFQSPYSAFNSLPPVEPFVTSDTATAFLAARLWDGGELVFNPEVAGGKGFGNAVTGIANYPNQEITRVGIEEPTPYIARLYLRQTFGFGGEQEKVEDGANQIAGSRDISRLTISVGKMGATDIVDDNLYSHDSRTSFLPWAMVYNGAWDYPANVRGYTYGVAFDLNQKDWTLRYGLFAVARFANSAPLDPHLLRANGHVVELETRYTLDGHPGKLRLLGYLNLAHMGKYSEAIAEMPVNPDITLTRAYRIKYGFGFNLEQELTKDLGAFARFGWDDGHTETWMFTEIDTTFLLGLTLKGRCWCRPQDQLGLALALNGLSSQHRDYLAAGGLGFIIGDGRLNYGLEKTLEAYYSLEVRKGLYFALDLQGVDHPAYNKDRGPVFIVSGRMHIEF